MKKLHAIGTICYRCGIDRKYSKKMGFTGCSLYGTFFEKHLWNTEEFEGEVKELQTNHPVQGDGGLNR